MNFNEFQWFSMIGLNEPMSRGVVRAGAGKARRDCASVGMLAFQTGDPTNRIKRGRTKIHETKRDVTMVTKRMPNGA